MKNTFFLLAAGLALATSAAAQSTIDSIRSKYQLQAMPDALTVEKTFPVLGAYQLASAYGVAQQVTVTLDTANKGIVWIDGLPEGRIKAYLRQSPGTYRIVGQRSGSGKQVAEGTLIFDPSTNQLNIALGKNYDSADPAGVFSLASGQEMATTEVKVKTKTGTSKTKNRIVFYSATKAATGTMTTPLQDQ